jgi:capsular polysaccharide biosynthesis protein
LILAVSVGVSAVYTAGQHSVYKAETTLVVRPNSRVEGTSNILRSLDTLERRSVIATFAKIPGTKRTAESVSNRLEMRKGEIRRYYIRASVVPNTNIMKIEVRGPDRKKVALVANAAASRTRRHARALYTIFALDTLEEAVYARHPIYPDPQRNYVAAGILGLFLGIGTALVFDQLRRPDRKAKPSSAAAGDGSTSA